MSDGALHTTHQVGSVDERLDDDTLWQGFLYLGDALLHVLDHLLEVLPLQHDGDTCHDLAFPVSGDGSKASGMSLLHLGDVAYLDRSAVDGLDRDVGNVIQRFRHTESSDVILVGILLDIATTGIGIVLLKRIEDFRNGDIIGIESVGIHRHLILLDEATPTADLGDTRRARQLFSHDPILNGSQLCQRILVFIPFLGSHGIMIYLAESRCHWSHLRIGVLRQILDSLLQHLVYLRPSPVDVGIIVEHECNDRQTTSRDASPLL